MLLALLLIYSPSGYKNYLQRRYVSNVLFDQMIFKQLNGCFDETGHVQFYFVLWNLLCQYV